MNNSSASWSDGDGSGFTAGSEGYVEFPIEEGERSGGLLPLKAKHNPPRAHVEPHIHRRFEQLLFVRRGGGRMILEDRQYEFRAPSILIVPSLTVHAFVFEEGTDRYVLSLGKKRFQDLMARGRELAEIFEAGRCVTFSQDERDYIEIERVLSKLEWEQGRTARCREIVTEALLIDLLVCILRKVQDDKSDPVPEPASYRELYKKFVSLVEIHHSEHWTLGQYADALLISVPRLRAICGSVSGESPIRIINSRIVLEAKRCLMYTSLTVAEIAYRLGFDDPSYFSRFFKARCEQTPTEYKVMKKGGALLAAK